MLSIDPNWTHGILIYWAICFWLMIEGYALKMRRDNIPPLKWYHVIGFIVLCPLLPFVVLRILLTR